MKNNSIIILFLILLCMTCEEKSENNIEKKNIDSIFMAKISKEMSLDNLKSTEFILTLESKLSDSLNSIYTPSLLFAWQEIVEYFKSPIEVLSSNSIDFQLINRSNTFQNALNKDEYETTIKTSIDGIEATAYFKKILPFAAKFHSQNQPLDFRTHKVRSFGLNYPDFRLLDYFEILYYLDEDHFAVKMFPADTSSEIILAKGINVSGTFSDLLGSTNKWIKEGRAEKVVEGNKWKYSFQDEDYLSIPVIKFNVGTHYSSLEEQKFKVNSKSYDVIKAYQRTAFIFDEYGALVESFSSTACDTSRPVPKKMIFDKPFVIFIKKKDITNPYFAMKVMNSELMEKK